MTFPSSLSSPAHFSVPSDHRNYFSSSANPFCNLVHGHSVACGSVNKLCGNLCGLNLRPLEDSNLQKLGRILNHQNEHKGLKVQYKDRGLGNLEKDPSFGESTILSHASTKSSSLILTQCSTTTAHNGGSPFLSIAVIGATEELARGKIFPALFALYYSGYLPESFSIYGYSRKTLTDKDFRSAIASTLTCRIDHHENCDEKIEAFLKRTYYLNGGYNNRDGMSKLNALMEHIEGHSEANQVFYLSVPQEALLDVASCVADNSQTQKGWNRVIIEKPFGFGAQSCRNLTQSLLSQFEENQLYRIDHLLGRNTIENITVLRFSNLVFMPLWNRNYIHNVQVIFSEDVHAQKQPRNLDCYGIVGDVMHSHILQTVALLAMEPPVSLSGDDIRNEKVKVLRSMRSLDPNDVNFGVYTTNSGGSNDDGTLNNQNPTYFAAAMYIDNARWDGVPFLIRAGRGLHKNRVEIRIQFRTVPGNLYHQYIGNFDLAINELILRDVPDEAILVRMNNKIPGLAMHLDASELNLLYKGKYNVEVPDTYEQLLHDVLDGDNHLFMRSDEVSAAWNVLSPVMDEIDNNNITPEPYELGSRGPEETIISLWAKHGVQLVLD